jgi:hypothetical protein
MTQTSEIIDEFTQLMDEFTQFVAEFTQLIDNVNVNDKDKDFQLKQLKQTLADVCNTNSKTTSEPNKDKDKPKKRGRPAKVSNKPKREPSAYNKYVKERMEQLKTEQPDVPAKDRMKMAAADWKLLTKEQQEAYKA